MAAKRKPTASIERWRGEPGVVLTAGEYEAVFLPGLGMLGASLRYQGTELVYLGGGPGRYRAGHPYFAVPGSRRSWILELPPRRHLELDAKSIPTGKATRQRAEREPIGARTFDDGYALGGDRRFALEGDGRRLQVRFGSNYPFAQVFAPPRSTFVAIEPMTAPTNALATGRCPVVRPGQRFTASFTVSAS